METWDNRWINQRSRIGNLNKDQQMPFVNGCVRRTFARLQNNFRKEVPSDKYSVVHDALKFLEETSFSEQVNSKVEELVVRLEAMIPGDDIPEVTIAGWSDFLNAVVFALQVARQVETEQNVFLTAAYSYQAVFEFEVLRKLPQAVLESELTAREQRSKACIDDIEFQLELLRRLELGTQIPPLDVLD